MGDFESVSGNVLVAGGPVSAISHRLGLHVSVFQRHESDWSLDADLNPNDSRLPRGIRGFGDHIAIAGDTIVATTNTGGDHDKAYVFYREGSNWEQEAILDVSDRSGDTAQPSVAISGDTILLGFPGKMLGWPIGRERGAVYVFVRKKHRWNEQARLNLDESILNSSFGEAVAIEGDTALIGAPHEGLQTGLWGSGSAYVFKRTGSSWRKVSKLVPPGKLSGENRIQFGAHVSLSKGEAAIQADAETCLNCYSPLGGGVYLFHERDGEWEFTEKFASQQTFPQNIREAAVEGSWLAILGKGYFYKKKMDKPAPDQVYVYHYKQNHWEEVARLGKDGMAYVHLAWDNGKLIVTRQPFGDYDSRFQFYNTEQQADAPAAELINYSFDQ